MANVREFAKRQFWWWVDQSPSNGSLSLIDLSLKAVIKCVSSVCANAGRNSRRKKALQDYFSTSLPTPLLLRLREMASANIEDGETQLAVLSMFRPFDKVVNGKVDLVGNLRYAIDLELDDDATNSYARWYPFYPLRPLSKDQLVQLYNTLLWTKDVKSLKEISVAVARDSLKVTNFPNILARAPHLTRVVILEGADNHTLRILGLNCHFLKHLDVSHSWDVSDLGLHKLLLRRPPNRKPLQLGNRIMSGVMGYTVVLSGSQLFRAKNPCWSTLETLILTGTQVTLEGCDFACTVLYKAYLYTTRPLIKISRMKMARAILMDATIHQTLLDAIQDVGFALLAQGGGRLALEYFTPLTSSSRAAAGQSGTDRPEESPTSVALVRKPHTKHVCMALKLQGAVVTSITLPFYSLEWAWSDLFSDARHRISIHLLAVGFPSLQYFRGVVKGELDATRVPPNGYLPHLRTAMVWSRCSQQAVNLLRYCASLQRVHYNHTDYHEEFVNDGEDPAPVTLLNHESLVQCFVENPRLAANLEDLTIRPALRLTKESLEHLVDKCRKLRKIGDLSTWSVTKVEMEEVAQKVRQEGRFPPAFSLFNTPPSDWEAADWDSSLPFD